MRFKSSFELPDPLGHSRALGRPVSPDLFIYKPQFPWVLSGIYRISSVGITAGSPFHSYSVFLGLFASSFFVVVVAHVTPLGLYGAAILYAARSAPASAYINFFRDMNLPPAASSAAKFAVSLPFTYHLFGGIRHLVRPPSFPLLCFLAHPPHKSRSGTRFAT